ncbi:MAG: Lrp/AsnC family transcriptional regulator [Syntrophomonadaceae bacterium]|nr:Lrp/AsnC family transcriptional regulator [Syntrophomonadaceae bacterium]
MSKLSSLERSLLDLLQNEFPVDIEPYRIMAEKLQCSEQEILESIQYMKNKGVIRRIGAVLDAKHMGFYSTLCTCMVADNRIEEVAGLINQQRGVTHNYLRDHEYNIWFTLTASSEAEARMIINRLESDSRVKIISMPATKVFKIKVSFEMSDTNGI